MDEHRYADRIKRAAAEAAEDGLGALVVSPSPDLAYLTGYDPELFERPTFLIIRADRELKGFERHKFLRLT